MSPASWVPSYLEGRVSTYFDGSANIYAVPAMFKHMVLLGNNADSWARQKGSNPILNPNWSQIFVKPLLPLSFAFLVCEMGLSHLPFRGPGGIM